eukprot:NODE_163_length_1951_cov_119.767613_g121_i0.p1 GENE.NODE_163_length_1951_cov_119.767613_g121_i0~~NODE_163_length_1951_cov_119.767613_g121_i0.p1  ORF type:complete len:493 (-),score=50.59 NODE_163_length_1951_cov_119.767613_g121_i0:283-1761(-)
MWWTTLVLLASATAKLQNLRISNACDEAIWVQEDFINHLPSSSWPYIHKIAGNAYLDLSVPEGQSSLQWRPKLRCQDDRGFLCKIGESLGIPPPPPSPVPDGGMWPPLDSKLEITVDPTSGGSVSHYDLSQVDGWTLPYTLQVTGNTGTCNQEPIVNCSGLDLASCPIDEDLSNGNDSLPELKSVDLRLKDANGTVIGCFSPCSILTHSEQNRGLKDKLSPPITGPEDSRAAPFCCPNPGSEYWGNAAHCSEGPAPKSKYSQAIKASGCIAYTYAYDDHRSLGYCTGDVSIEMTFYCPKWLQGEQQRSSPAATSSPVPVLHDLPVGLGRATTPCHHLVKEVISNELVETQGCIDATMPKPMLPVNSTGQLTVTCQSPMKSCRSCLMDMLCHNGLYATIPSGVGYEVMILTAFQCLEHDGSQFSVPFMAAPDCSANDLQHQGFHRVLILFLAILSVLCLLSVLGFLVPHRTPRSIPSLPMHDKHMEIPLVVLQ